MIEQALLVHYVLRKLARAALHGTVEGEDPDAVGSGDAGEGDVELSVGENGLGQV